MIEEPSAAIGWRPTRHIAARAHSVGVAAVQDGEFLSDALIIRRANEDLRSALAHDPASPLLLQLLHSTSQQEIDLYTSVAQSTEPLLMRRTKA